MRRGEFFLMNEADILANTYFDKCMIERIQDIENPDTGITEQGYAPIKGQKEAIPCALSQSGLGSAGALAVVENSGSVNVTYEEQKLFTGPGVDVLKGDRIQITQSTGYKQVLYAKKPFFYPSHTEINLTGSEIDGKR